MISSVLNQGKWRANLIIGIVGSILLCFFLLFMLFEDSYIFNYIQDSPFIILIIASGFFLGQWLFNIISDYLGRNRTRDFKNHLIIIVLSFFTLFIWVGLHLGDWETMTASNFICSVFLIYGTYFSFTMIRNKWLSKTSFLITEFYKILILIFLSLLFLSLGKTVGNLLVITKESTGFPVEPFLIFMFTLSFGIGNFLNNLREKVSEMEAQEERVINAEKIALDKSAQFQSLQSSINPHFLYNSLNSIASLATIDSLKTEKMAIALSDFYKYVTNKQENDYTNLSRELEMINNYLEVEKIRHGKKLKIEINVENEAKDKLLPHFLLQPLIENAIKYGYSNDQIIIKLTASFENNQLDIKISDTGLPFEENMKMGFGLKSVYQKLSLLFPTKHDISFINKPEKYVHIVLDQNLNR